MKTNAKEMNKREIPEDAVVRLYVNEEGVVVGAEDLEGNDIEYDKEELKTLIGARLYTPNRCCWRRVRGKWRCKESFCK